VSIWTDALLDQLAADAQSDISVQVNCLFHRFYLATTAGTAEYTLPAKVRGVTRITWRGKKIDPTSWLDIEIWYNGSQFIDPSQSTPQFYALNPNNVKKIRFYPSPDESFAATGDPYAPTANESKCLISCWRSVESGVAAATLPSYTERRTIKAYVLWRAFEKEGKGQNLTAAAYYKRKYEFLISQFRRINEGAYIAKRYALGEDALLNQSRPAKPVLPANFERTIF